MALEDYKIFPAVHPVFDDLPEESLDFKRHLKADKALDKKVTKSPDGRPVKAEYSLDGIIVAQIRFDFVADATTNFLISRDEFLQYIMNDDTLGTEIHIKHKTYDMTNPVDADWVIKERRDARKSVISDLENLVLSIMMSPLIGFTLDKAIVHAIPFTNQFSAEIDRFIEVGSADFKTALEQIDLSLTSFTWLSTVHPEYGANVRDVMTSILGYSGS